MRRAHLSILMLLLILPCINAVHAAEYDVTFTDVRMMCIESESPIQVGWLGFVFQYKASYTSAGDAIIRDKMYVTEYITGGNLYWVSQGTGIVDYNNGNWGQLTNETVYPYTVLLVLDMYVGGTLNGNDVVGGTIVDSTTASAVCTEPGWVEVQIDALKSGPETFDPQDGRISPDAAAPFAAYCTDWGLHVYGINEASDGWLAFTVALNVLSEPPPAENTLIVTAGNLSLYRLTTGEWQINAAPDAEGKEYVLIWEGCSLE